MDMAKKQNDYFGFEKAIDKKALSKALKDPSSRKKLESIFTKVK
jgi:hypothetical protein